MQLLNNALQPHNIRKQKHPITSLQSGWAEQSPEMWWEQTVQAIRKLNNSKKFDPKDIAAIGISYQMHGLGCGR